MAQDRDNRFRPKLGKSPARDGKQPKRFINRVLNAAARFGPLPPGGPGRKSSYRGQTSLSRGRIAARMMGHYSRRNRSRDRRVVIKARIVKLAGTGLAKAQAHVRYVERDGTGRDSEPGRFYDSASDAVDGDTFMEHCQGDRHQFRFIVSAEDATELEDLKPFIRDLMSQMEQDLGTKLDWIAVDHFNTDNPHTHVIARGKDDQGKDLVIARDYISHGMRQRAAELVTLELGPRTDLEIQNAMRREVQQDRFTGLDRRMLRAAEDRRVDLRHEPEGGYARFSRSLMTGRLQKLERMELAHQIEPSLWRLSDHMERTLRRLGERTDIIKTMHVEMKRQGIDHGEADYAIFDPGVEGARSIVGRIVSKGLSDELNDRTYIIVDGVDGRTHYVDIGHDPESNDYQAGAVVEITPRPTEP